MTSTVTATPHRSRRPVIVVPGRNLDGTARTWDRGVPASTGTAPEASWPAQEPAPTRRGAAATFAVMVCVVALVSGLLALAAPGVVRSAIDGARTMLDGGSATRQDPPTGLDPEVQARFDEAAQAAAVEGITLTINSGWRSAEAQQDLVERAVEQYGSVQEARRWVAPAEASAHVQGMAIDVGPADGAQWLTEHGAQFGLCQVFANEPWHFEPRTDPGGTCPALVPDASGLWS